MIPLKSVFCHEWKLARLFSPHTCSSLFMAMLVSAVHVSWQGSCPALCKSVVSNILYSVLSFTHLDVNTMKWKLDFWTFVWYPCGGGLSDLAAPLPSERTMYQLVKVTSANLLNVMLLCNFTIAPFLQPSGCYVTPRHETTFLFDLTQLWHLRQRRRFHNASKYSHNHSAGGQDGGWGMGKTFRVTMTWISDDRQRNNNIFSKHVGIFNDIVILS